MKTTIKFGWKNSGGDKGRSGCEGTVSGFY